MPMQPGDFIAQLNGVRSDYFRINHAFRSIKIPKAGTHMISVYSAEVFYRVVGHVRLWDSDSRWIGITGLRGEQRSVKTESPFGNSPRNEQALPGIEFLRSNFDQ